MKVTILSGGTSYKVGDRFKLALRGETVDVSEAEAEALIKLGAACPALHTETSPEADFAATEEPEDAGDVSTPPSPENEAEATEEAEGAAYSVDMTAAELRAIMEANGLTAKPRMTKREMVDALDEFFAEDDDEAPPDLSAEAPVV